MGKCVQNVEYKNHLKSVCRTKSRTANEVLKVGSNKEKSQTQTTQLKNIVANVDCHRKLLIRVTNIGGWTPTECQLYTYATCKAMSA